MRPKPLAFVVLSCAALAPGCAEERGNRPNVLLITLDTTRRDHLGMYGHTIPTSPNLDRLAADSVVYTNAYAVSSWTLPTHASMFTGKFPSAHGANYDPEGPLQLGEAIGEQYGHYRARPIAENEVTLAQILSRHGYATGGIIAGPWMKEVFRLGKGFEHYDDDGVTALNGRPAADVTDRAIEFVDEHADEPFFLFLNYYDAHSPWWQEDPQHPERPPRPFHDPKPVVPPGFDPAKTDRVSLARIYYDAEIRYMDAEIGRLLDHLRARGLYEDAWIFVLADHGDLIGDPVLGEEGLFGHGDSLTQPEIHIPFFVKDPGATARRGEDPTPVQQVDILPTIVERLGLEMPPNVQGTALGGERHPLVAELYKLPFMNRTVGANPKDWRHLGDWRVVVEGDDKLGWSSNGTHYLVDLEQDPAERVNAYAREPERARQLMELLDRYLATFPEPGATGEVEQPSQEELDALRELGYGAGAKTEDDDESAKDAAKPAGGGEGAPAPRDGAAGGQ